MEKIKMNSGAIEYRAPVFECQAPVFEYRDSFKLKKSTTLEIIDEITDYGFGGTDTDGVIYLWTTAPKSDEEAEEMFSVVKDRLKALGYI